MKSFFVLILFFIIISNIAAQQIEPAPGDKAAVYFVRISSYSSAANFLYFDNSSFIGKFNGTKYMRYECEPGKHLFWANSENNSYLEAQLEAGKVYFIEAVPLTGVLRAGVKLIPLNPESIEFEDKLISIRSLMDKQAPLTFKIIELEAKSEKYEEVVKIGIKKYERLKGRGEDVARLTKTMFYDANGTSSQIVKENINENKIQSQDESWQPDNTMTVSETEDIELVNYKLDDFNEIADTGNIASPSNDIASLGLGMGLDYGGFGGNLQLNLHPSLGLFLGGGYALAGFGYNAGFRLNFSSRVRFKPVTPYLTAMYGYNTAIKVENAENFNKLFYGPTVGFGIDYKARPGKSGYWSFALLIPIRSGEVDEYIDNLKNNYGVEFKNELLPFGISVGYRFILN